MEGFHRTSGCPGLEKAVKEYFSLVVTVNDLASSCTRIALGDWRVVTVTPLPNYEVRRELVVLFEREKRVSLSLTEQVVYSRK
jgi:hypothetical protein